MYYIAITDYLLLIPYLALLFYLAVLLAKTNTTPETRIYFFISFWLRMIGCILLCMVLQYYYGYGDSFTYFKGSNFYTDRFSEDLGNIKYLFAEKEEVASWYINHSSGEKIFSGYFGNPANNMVMKISAVLSYLCFNRFLIISLFFAFFSFIGQWKLFLVFRDINKNRYTKLIAIAVLFSPSIWFWGSGLAKDSVCVGALGIVLYLLYKFVVKKKISVIYLGLLICCFWLITIIKSYIAGVVLLSLFILFVMIFVKSIKNILAKIAFTVLIIFSGVIVISQIDLSVIIQDSVKELASLANTFQQGYQTSEGSDEGNNGGILTAEFDPSLSGIVLRSPGIIFTCLYRPFIWESRSIMILFTALESLVILCFSVYLIFKTKFIYFVRFIFFDPFLFFSFIFSILFALVIGFTTFNFGTMIRYKVVFLPLFYFFHVRMLTLYTIHKKIDNK